MKTPIAVLIADDHPIFRAGLQEVLAPDASLKIVGQAGDGAAAWRLIQELQPRVAILDLDMPGLSGLEVARKVLAAKLPVALVVLTMYKEARIFEEAIEAGILGYVLKESAVHDLLGCIQSVLAGQAFISPALSSLLLDRKARTRSLLEAKPELQTLTPTERRILSLVAENLTSKEIAERVQISAHTVENHRANICRKLNLQGSHSLLKFAFDHKPRLTSET
ncbi:MAG TPA: response regulator transcription factor [Verrucomicrobiae bacterium]|jgi:DNA-binding NarL/FixJ family response regulator|nr:response regulator transcription factor [Verrucomicrobiae bacterium]